MACVTSMSFSICVNGDKEGFFKGSRGLRQDDPTSPYVFTLIMEVLSLIMNDCIKENSSFKFHYKCKVSGLLPNINKSTTFFDSVTANIQGKIVQILSFEDIDKLLKGFLWSQTDNSEGKAKVAWKGVCVPKDQGGLGLRPLKEWNQTLIVKQIWRIVTNEDSLLSKWVNLIRPKDVRFWDINPGSNDS
ncbi:uncharacterized protein [Rutidosis leptorrhynchoides]|uniref:uncharacterized protein n=1 Tax=Rutidosis leptorrhynchoides TaxID=125765 RepID=UPI003A996C6A